MGIRGKGMTTAGLVVGVTLCGLSWASASALASSTLPDGRAWEMVSPVEKHGGEINGIGGVVPDNGLPEGGVVQAAADGNSITYLSLIAFPGSKNGEPVGEPQGAPLASQYLSRREEGDWSTEDLTAPMTSGTYPAAGNGAPYKAFSSDLSKGLMLNGKPPVETPPLGGAPAEYVDYYLRDNRSGSFEALLRTPPAESPEEFFMELVGVAPDLRHVVIETPAALTPEATRQEGQLNNLYDWTAGRLWPVNVLPTAEEHPAHPEATALGNAELGMGFDEARTISSDGSSVFWRMPSLRALFVRRNIGRPQSPTDGQGHCTVPADACSIQIDATKIAEPKTSLEMSGRGEFVTASANGAKVFFTDPQRLTPDSTASGERAHQDLYQLDVETGRLTDLTVDVADPRGATVLGVLEASEDGSYVYFVAEGALPETEAEAGHDNLYVWHETAPGRGTTTFIAALSSQDNGNGGFHDPGVAHDWARSIGERTTRVAAGGRRLVFMSSNRLTGYDNAGYEEVYLYDASSNSLTCVSCNPSGDLPIGPSGIPGGTPWRTVGELGTYQSRALSEDGSRVFFDSRDALVPQDENGAQDVYEWEQDGAGTCGRQGGCVFLLSGATSRSDSAFVDASASGNDVFFVSRAQLAAQDTDQLQDLYDARVGGGLPVAPALPPCEGQGCLQLPSGSASGQGVPASASFSGLGNIPPVTSKPAIKVVTRKRHTPRKRRKRGHKANTHKASSHKAGSPHGSRKGK